MFIFQTRKKQSRIKIAKISNESSLCAAKSNEHFLSLKDLMKKKRLPGTT
jgi:hypothetical protein